MILPLLIALHSPQAAVSIDPATLSVTLTPADAKSPLPISSPQPALGPIASLLSDDTTTHWTYSDKHLAVSFELDGPTLIAHFTADAASSFTFPAIPSDPAYTSYLLPMFEGFDIPADDADWIKHLSTQDPLDTLADLSMPFWGIQTPTHTLTFLLPNPFGNALSFHDDHARLASSFTHTFRKNWPIKEYSVRITLSDPSPIAPALVYRQYLKDTHQFVPLADKIATLPDVAKLIGAPHVYLWGGGKITPGDILNFKSLAAEILRAPESSPGKRLFGLFTPEIQKLISSLPQADYVDNYTKSRITDDLSRILKRDDFPPKLFADTFPNLLHPIETWGDGVSPKMIHTLQSAGLDRLRIVVSDVQDLRDNPATIPAAKAAGYLIGPYDSFHTIHRPGMEDSFDTSQFDQHLYDTGAIINENGKPSPGFQHKGYHLSPIAAKSAVEARVTSWFHQTPANCWFIDCDAFGECFDDFSPVHPATAQEDMNARLARMAWIRNTFHCVIGSEGGSSFAAGVLDFAEGPETPVVGWGDADLSKDKSSPYYLGRYYPPNEPEVFFKSVPLKPSYYKFYFAPQYRLPLYETALHDSLVATHHWSFATFKLSDQVGPRQLLELLYGVPPLYHLNMAEFAKRKKAILSEFKVFSPLHKQIALLPLTQFSYVTADHLVQQTTFGDGIATLTANFSDSPYTLDSISIPPHSIRLVRKDSDPVLFTP